MHDVFGAHCSTVERAQIDSAFGDCRSASGAIMCAFRLERLLATVLLSASGIARVAAVDSLPTSWRKGIATNYGGAQDGKVRSQKYLNVACRPS